jgi:hypothetical protein
MDCLWPAQHNLRLIPFHVTMGPQLRSDLPINLLFPSHLSPSFYHSLSLSIVQHEILPFGRSRHNIPALPRLNLDEDVSPRVCSNSNSNWASSMT